MKAVLVIDIQDGTDPSHYGVDRIWEYIEEEDDYRTILLPGRHTEMLKFKSLPEKRPVHYNDEIFGEVENLTNIGWNKCVEELEK